MRPDRPDLPLLISWQLRYRGHGECEKVPGAIRVWYVSEAFHMEREICVQTIRYFYL